MSREVIVLLTKRYVVPEGEEPAKFAAEIGNYLVENPEQTLIDLLYDADGCTPLRFQVEVVQ